jgi:hypothetical protein
MLVTGLVLTGMLVAGCTGSGTGNGVSSSRSRTSTATLPSGTSSPSQTGRPTSTKTVTRTIEPPTTTRTSAAQPNTTPAPTPVATSSVSGASTTSVSAASAPADSTAPSWVWWLLGLVALALVIGIPLTVRSRRRSAWEAALAACEQEVAWFARVLVPQLSSTAMSDGAVAVWATEGGRVSALRERLSELEASASNDQERARGGLLSDAVLRSQIRIESLLALGTDPNQVAGFQLVTADLEAVLSRWDAQTSGGARHPSSDTRGG